MSAQNQILNYLQNKRYGGEEWVYKDSITRNLFGHTADYYARECRRLAEKGYLEKREVNGVVQYRKRDENVVEYRKNEANSAK